MCPNVKVFFFEVFVLICLSSLLGFSLGTIVLVTSSLLHWNWASLVTLPVSLGPFHPGLWSVGWGQLFGNFFLLISKVRLAVVTVTLWVIGERQY